MESGAELISIFETIFKKKKEIQLLNVFKGVPISNTAILTDVGASSINIKTDKFQVVCLYRERETYIQSDLIQGTIKASVSHIDFPKVEAVVSNFQPTKGVIGARNQIRVEPETPIQGAIMTTEMRRPLTAELADISQEGLAIHIKTRFFFQDYYKLDAPITIYIPAANLNYSGDTTRTSVTWKNDNDFISRSSNVSLRLNPLAGQMHETSTITHTTNKASKKTTEIELRGTIVNLRKDSLHNWYRIGIKLARNDPSRGALVQFITQRQTEIINELRAVYNLLSMISNK